MRKIKNSKSFKKRRTMLTFLGVGILLSTPMVLTGCSSSVSQEIENNTVWIDNGSKVASNMSLNDFVNNGLQSQAGMEAYIKDVDSSLILKWYQLLNERSNLETYKQNWSEQNKSINDQWNDLVTKYKKYYGSDWAAKLQQVELDPNGGTESSWKESKWKDWARNKFSSDLFSKNYLTILNDSNGSQTAISRRDRQTLLTVLEKNKLNGNGSGTDNTQTFGFSNLAVGDNVTDSQYIDVDKEYANFVQYVYDKWIEVDNPFVVNMVLWKYGTPVEGINSIYNNVSTSAASENSSSDSSSDSSTTSNDGTYEFPYFTDTQGTQEPTGTITKFKSFVNASQSNNNFLNSTGTTTTSGKSQKDYGIKNISTNYTDDSSTLILAKNSSIFTDLYPEFAAASSYQFWKNKDSSSTSVTLSADGTLITNIDSKIGKSIGTPTSSNGFDEITSMFTSTSKFTNTSNGSSTENPYQVQLSHNYLQQIINPNGPLNTLVSNTSSSLYVIDSFVATDSNLNDFIFIRNSAGVHAVSVDGWEWIKEASTPADRKKRAGQILLYRSLLNTNFPSDSDLSIDINSNLSTFFSDNMDWLIYSYANANKSQNLFNLANIEISENEKNLAKAINAYLFESKHYDIVKSYSEKLYSTKAAYSKNYGMDAIKNGLAAPWSYNKIDETNAKNLGLNSSISFEVALTDYISYSPYKEKNSSITSNLPTDMNNDFVTWSELISKISTLVNSMNIVPLNSSFEGFKYSQYIYTNFKSINVMLTTYGSTNNIFGNSVKENILKKYIEKLNQYDLTNNEFKSSDNDVKSGLNSGMSNFFYTTVFDSLNPLWTKYTETTVDKEKINSYKKQLWFDSINRMDATADSSYLSYLTLIATVSYLLENNAENFLTYLQSKIPYGTNAYVAWSNSQNTFLQSTNDVKSTVKDMLDSTNNLKMNNNNSYSSDYVGFSTMPTVDKNTSGVYVDSNSYYNVVNDMIGFLGLQTNDSNSLPTVISERLFTNPKEDNDDGVGVLYAYGSKDELIKNINNLSTINDVVTLATNIKDKLKYFDISSVTDTNKTLAQRKEALVSLVNRLPSDNKYFAQRNGYIGSQPKNGSSTTTTTNESATPITDSTNTWVQYGAYAWQINFTNLSSTDSLLNALGKSSSEQNAKSIFYNLVIQAAMDSDLQALVLNSISFENKVLVYDVRLNNQLGSQWVSNWKSQTSS